MPEDLERCLACRARLADDGVCPRCGCDFSLARQAMEQSRNRLAHAFRALAAGEPDVARRAVEASLAMQRQPLAEAIEQFLGSVVGHIDEGQRSVLCDDGDAMRERAPAGHPGRYQEERGTCNGNGSPTNLG
jgi:hypothetical protein